MSQLFRKTAKPPNSSSDYYNKLLIQKERREEIEESEKEQQIQLFKENLKNKFDKISNINLEKSELNIIINVLLETAIKNRSLSYGNSKKDDIRVDINNLFASYNKRFSDLSVILQNFLKPYIYLSTDDDIKINDYIFYQILCDIIYNIELFENEIQYSKILTILNNGLHFENIIKPYKSFFASSFAKKTFNKVTDEVISTKSINLSEELKDKIDNKLKERYKNLINELKTITKIENNDEIIMLISYYLKKTAVLVMRRDSLEYSENPMIHQYMQDLINLLNEPIERNLIELSGGKNHKKNLKKY